MTLKIPYLCIQKDCGCATYLCIFHQWWGGINAILSHSISWHSPPSRRQFHPRRFWGHFAFPLLSLPFGLGFRFRNFFILSIAASNARIFSSSTEGAFHFPLRVRILNLLSARPISSSGVRPPPLFVKILLFLDIHHEYPVGACSISLEKVGQEVLRHLSSRPEDFNHQFNILVKFGDITTHLGKVRVKAWEFFLGWSPWLHFCQGGSPSQWFWGGDSPIFLLLQRIWAPISIPWVYPHPIQNSSSTNTNYAYPVTVWIPRGCNILEIPNCFNQNVSVAIQEFVCFRHEVGAIGQNV